MEIFDYDNVLLLPRQCRVESRSECDPSIEFGGRRFKLPVVPANMKTVLDERIARLEPHCRFRIAAGMHAADLALIGLDDLQHLLGTWKDGARPVPGTLPDTMAMTLHPRH